MYVVHAGVCWLVTYRITSFGGDYIICCDMATASGVMSHEVSCEVMGNVLAKCLVVVCDAAIPQAAPRATGHILRIREVSAQPGSKGGLGLMERTLT